MAQFEYRSINGLNFIQIYNVFSPEQNEIVWTTYDYLKYNFVGPEGTASATDADGNPKKKNVGLFLDEVRPRPQICNILSSTIFNGIELIENQFPSDSVFRSAKNTNWDSQLMQYYCKDGEEYDSHQDLSQFTAITFFNREPKNFEGGDIEFPEHGIRVPFQNNCGIIFPGIIKHKVHPITQINKNTDYGGRLSLSMFTGLGIKGR
jgi:hypothetical protein